jgi:hypothetical protein
LPDPNNTATYNYLAQLAYEPDVFGIPEPRIQVFSIGPSYPSHCDSTDYRTLVAPTLVANYCSSALVAKLKDGSPIVMRLLVESAVAEQPKVKVELGADCAGASCTQTCALGPFSDSEIEALHALRNIGQGGVTVHHWDTRFDSIEIGKSE